nr:aspartate carbamoyltransferase [Candidatus Delongbacteria bacterium]
QLSEHDQIYYETTDLFDYLFELDILYVTRIQKERFFDAIEYEKVKNAYILDKRILTTIKDNLKILHPLPRVNEIHTSLDSTPQAEYFQQSKNGVTIRKALLSLVLGINL